MNVIILKLVILRQDAKKAIDTISMYNDVDYFTYKKSQVSDSRQETYAMFNMDQCDLI